MPSDWTTPAQLLPLPPNQLQLWRIELPQNAPRLLAACTELLTVAEQDTASRRREGQTRNQFIAGRACLRILLGNALGIAPSAVSIHKASAGKLFTPPMFGHGIAYNLAHSRDTILIALRRQGSVGIDIEHINPASDPLEIATRWFTPQETTNLTALSDPLARSRLFFRYWTRKEAIAKADGRGLLVALNAFDVAFDPTESTTHSIYLPAAREVGDLDTNTKTQYLLRDLDLGPDFAGALAIESPDSTIIQYQFPFISTHL